MLHRWGLYKTHPPKFAILGTSILETSILETSILETSILAEDFEALMKISIFQTKAHRKSVFLDPFIYSSI